MQKVLFGLFYLNLLKIEYYALKQDVIDLKKYIKKKQIREEI